MKNTKIIIAAVTLAAVSALSACKSEESVQQTSGITALAADSQPETMQVTAIANEPDDHAVTTTAATTEETEAQSAPETKAETSFTGFSDIHAVTPEELEAFYADNGWGEDTVIHLPIQTAAEDLIPEESIETTVFDVSDIGYIGDLENLGEYKDESYWNRVLDDSGKEASNSVFIVSVDADTTDEMMQEVIDKYNLEVIYDYLNFSMYALKVPEPLDAEGTETFINELTENYSFIFMVEPDSIMYLDSDSTADMLLF